MLRVLTEADLPHAAAVLEVACPWDRAGVVAAEKLLLPGPKVMPTAWGWFEGEAMLGVAAQAGDRLRVLAVYPGARGAGIGSALLGAAEQSAKGQGAARLGCLDEAGNYLAPGIDERNHETIAWLEKRGYVRGEPRTNLLVDVRGNPRVTDARFAELLAAARGKGYHLARAGQASTGGLTGARALLDAIETEFGGAWPFEVARALVTPHGGVWVAMRDGEPCAFAAHDGNNSGLGWFGPAGTWPEHRGQGLGEVLLLGCLLEVALHHAQCEIAWIGPEPFYEKSAGVAGRRTFVPMRKPLP